jgi:hypothetical protein
MMFAQTSPEAAAEAVGSAVGAGVGLGLALVVAVIQALIGALIIQVATKAVCRFKPSYGMAFKAVLVVAITMFAVNAITHLLDVHSSLGLALAGLVGFIVGAAIYGQLLKGPSGPIGTGRGVLVSLVAALVGILIAVVLLLIRGALSSAA